MRTPKVFQTKLGCVFPSTSMSPRTLHRRSMNFKRRKLRPCHGMTQRFLGLSFRRCLAAPVLRVSAEGANAAGGSLKSHPKQRGPFRRAGSPRVPLSHTPTADLRPLGAGNAGREATNTESSLIIRLNLPYLCEMREK